MRPHLARRATVRGLVVWEPFALAIVMGLLVSAAIYFVVMWPQVEPVDDVRDEPALAGLDPARHEPGAPIDPPAGDRGDDALSSNP